MQYVKVFVDTKSAELDKYYYYAIPAKILPYICKYSVVEVPYGLRKKLAIVAEIVKHIDSKIKNKLKPIIKIVHRFPVIDDRHFYIAQELSKYYLINMGQMLFVMMPEISKKIDYSAKYHKIEMTLHKKTHKYLLVDSKSSRIEYYIKIIQKTLSTKKSVLVLVPDLDANIDLVSKVYNHFGDKTIVFDCTDSISIKTKKWLSTFEKQKIVMGKRKDIFRFPHNLGTIIIEEPNHFGYKEEQSSHYHALKATYIICQITGANMFVGEDHEYISDIREYKVIRKNYASYKHTQIVTIAQNVRQISQRIFEIAKNNVKNNRRLLIISDKKEESSGVICTDCNHIFYCDRCEVLERKISDNTMVCPKCGKKSPIPFACPVCKSMKITGFGETLKIIQEKMEYYFRQKSQIILNNNDRISKNIVIASKHFASVNQNNFDDVLILSWEGFCARNALIANEEVLDNIIKISTFTKNNIYIQTKNIDDESLYQIANKKIRQWYKNELILRKNYHLPPYYRIIKITSKNIDRSICIKEIHKLAEKISQNIEKKYYKISEGIKKRDKYYMHLILSIKSDEYEKIHQILIDNFKSYNLSRYIIDVDPNNLI